MSWVDRLLGRDSQEPERALSVNDWIQSFSFNGNTYPFIPSQTLLGEKEEVPPTFTGYNSFAYAGNPVVFACLQVRLMLFAQARFMFQQMRNGRPGDLFGTAELGILESPWPNGTTGDLLARMEQDASIAGNFYATRVDGRIVRLRPDWVSIVLGSRMEPEQPGWGMDVEVAGYLYHPGGYNQGDPVPLLPEQVCHYAPVADPAAHFRGMSWLTPVIREVEADRAATTHKSSFFQNGATPNMLVKAPETLKSEAYNRWIELFKQNQAGAENAYKTLFLGGGMDATVVGTNLQEVSFAETQAAGETRIAAAAGVPPVIAGLTKGLESATYSNYKLALRRFVDLTMVYLWQNAAASMATLVTVPGGSRLSFDSREVPALQQDELDAAQIEQTKAATIAALVNNGWVPETVVPAVLAGDLALMQHTGLLSVQLQPPNTAAPPTNGAPTEPAVRALQTALEGMVRSTGE